MAGYLVATAYNILRIARLLDAREMDTGPPGMPVAAPVPIPAGFGGRSPAHIARTARSTGRARTASLADHSRFIDDYG